MRWKIFFGFVVGVIFFSLFVSATANISNFYIQTSYSSGGNISGWINISFENQNTNETLKDSFGNSIDLSSLLNFNPEYNYTANITTGNISSGFQKIYLDNASFNLPFGNLPEIKYQINLSNTILIEKNISVISSYDLIGGEIKSKKDALNNFTASLNIYSPFIQSQIKEILDVTNLQKNLTNLDIIYNSTSTGNYSEITDVLNKIIIPKKVFVNENADLVSFVSDKDRIDLEFIKKIGGGDYDSANEDSYKEAILFWNQENLDPRISFKSFQVNYGSYSEHLMSYVFIKLGQTPTDKVFLIIDEMNQIKFMSNYNPVSDGGYTYIDLSEEGDSIGFTTIDKISISNPPLVISPQLDLINLSGSGENVIDSDTESKVSKWVLFSLIALFLVIVFSLAYALMKVWYDKKYENYLFKNKNQLYNLVVYIHNAKKKGIPNNEIEKNLRKAKWSGEQIRYIMRKYAGKRTGMWSPFSANTENKIHKI